MKSNVISHQSKFLKKFSQIFVVTQDNQPSDCSFSAFFGEIKPKIPANCIANGNSLDIFYAAAKI